MSTALKGKAFVDPAKNELQLVRAVYDFSVDAGATGVYEAIEATGDCVIVDAWIDVHAAVTSSGTGTFDLGVTGSSSVLMNDKTKANATLGATIAATAGKNKLDDGSMVILELVDSAFTAGKLEICALIAKF